jgi:hypothetical protein
MIRPFRALGIAFAFLPLAMSSEGFSAVVIGKCQPNEVKYAVSSSRSGTESRTYVNIPEATIRFAQGGTIPSCVIVYFSSEAQGTFGANSIVRALLDDMTPGLPREIQFAADDTVQPATRTAIFIFPNVSPGAHRLQMQYRTGGGNRTTIGVHTTQLHYTR